MSAKHWCFTLNNPTEEQKKLFENWKPEQRECDHGLEPPQELLDDVKYLCCQLERGDETLTPHIQGYVCFHKKKYLNVAKLLFPGNPHMEICKGTPQQNRNYCTKVGGRIAGPWQYGTFPEGKGKRNDLEKFTTTIRQRYADGLDISDTWAFEEFPGILAKYPRFLSTVRRILAKPAATPFVPNRGWQNDLSLVLSGEPSERQVHWYYEEVGNVGKSYFANNYRSDNGRFGYVVTGGRHTDIFYAYNYEPVVFFDWARDSEDSFPYKVVEAFKNGYFLNTKYESSPVRFKVPHVVVFANFKPDVNKLSRDRWDIYNINPFGL